MPFSNPFRRAKKDKTTINADVPDEYTRNNIKSALSNGNKVILERPSLLFHVQLAHGSPTVKIGGFSNVRELYEKIANSFNIPFSEVIFCTLNTHKCDMERLLGGQIGLEDFLFAHIKGERKQAVLTKTHPAIGLTITDNGTGYPFVKRVKDKSIAASSDTIRVGDHIEAIDQKSTVGCRHFQVAKLLKEMPIGSTFTVTLVEPQKAFDMISQRSTAKSALSDNNIGTGKSTLRLRSKGPATVEAMPTEIEDKAMRRIDDLLDTFLGIRDMELASTIWECGKDKRNPEELITSLNEQLGDFGFPQEFIFDVWGIVLDARSMNNNQKRS